MTRPKLLWLLALLVIPLSGCAGLGLEPPDLLLTNLQLKEVTVLESSGEVALRVVNGNAEPLAIDGLSFNLRLNGRKIGKIISGQRLEVPRLASETLNAELHVSHFAMLTLVQELMETESVNYSMSGKVYLLTDLGRRSVRVEKAGRVNFDGDQPVIETDDGV